MVGVPIAVLLFIVAYPTVQMAYYAFHDINMVSLFKGDYGLIGFTNFERVLTSDRFHGSVLHLIQYLFFGAVLQVVIGTALALILHHCVRNNAGPAGDPGHPGDAHDAAALHRGRAVALPLQPVERRDQPGAA